MREKLDKIKRSFTIPAALFSQLKIHSVKKNIPFSVVLCGIIEAYLQDPDSFTVDFSKYK